MPNKDPKTKYFNPRTRKLEQRCGYCPKRYALNRGTRVIKAHLNACHQITDKSRRTTTNKKRQLSLEESLSTIAKYLHLRRCLNGLGETIQGDPLEVIFVRMITSNSLLLRLVESLEFRDFVYYLNKDADTFLPAGHSTIQEWILRQRDSQKNHQKQRLHNARSIIYLCVDAGQSLSNKPLLVITAHYVAEDKQLEKILLAVKEIKGKHTGENMSKIVIEVIDDQGIALKLGYFQMDNARSNDTMLHALSAGKCLTSSCSPY